MKQQDYHSSITANISPEEAFANISQVSAWWTTSFEGSAQKQNDVFTVRFGETFVTFKVIEMVAHKKIVWQVIDCYLHWLTDKKEWSGTKIVWEISTANDAVKIDMTHIGLVPGIECYENCEKGWNHFVKESLFKLLTAHKGLPETPATAR